MTHQIATRRENVGFLIASYAILVAAGVVGLRFGPPLTPALRWMIAGLLAAIALIQAGIPGTRKPLWRVHLYIIIHGGLVATLMFLQPGWTMYPVLFVSPIMQAILAFPRRQAIGYQALFTILTAASFAVGISVGEGLMALFLYGVMYSLLGGFAGLLSRADAARRESQMLLEELQSAHAKLQDYALRAEEMAVVEERNRLAREMHDTLGHRLTVTSVQLEAAQRLCPIDPGRAESLVGTAREQVREALSELRATVATLRSPLEADLHLRSALRRLITQFEEATGLTINQALPEELPPMPETYRLALYRAAQEALTNVQKHAEAQQVWLVLTVGDSAVTLLVSDDGRGATLSRDHSGFGLHGLRERAEQLGGSLHFEPRPGGGTQLAFGLPLSQEHARA
ncbi:MAG: sensor histidine kinase [Anaerolineae bacterium]|nr:sensor histidine kinase [Anaerolineae bacterium]